MGGAAIRNLIMLDLAGQCVIHVMVNIVTLQRAFSNNNYGPVWLQY